MIEVIGKLEGFDDIDAALKAMVPKVRNKVIRKGLRAGAKIVNAAVKAAAPVSPPPGSQRKVGGAVVKTPPGNLRDSFKVQSGRRRKGEINIRVSPGRKWFVGDMFYAGFQEFGFRIGKRKNRKQAGTPHDRRKKIPGKHFAERAFKASLGRAVNAAIAAMRAAHEKAVKEAAATKTTTSQGA